MRLLTETYGAALGACGLFAGLGPDAVRRLLTLTDARSGTYGRGAVLHRPYTPMTRFGLILSGAAYACSDDIDGNRVLLAEVLPGATFGEALCLLRVPDSPVFILAPDGASVLWMSPDRLFEPGADESALRASRRLTELLARRTLAMNGRIHVLSGRRLRDRLNSYFFRLAEEQKSRYLTLPFGREGLADYVGADRSAVCRELAAMKRDGLIDYHKNTVRLIPPEAAGKDSPHE